MAKASKNKEHAQLEDIVKQLFGLLQIKAQLEVQEDKDNDALLVNIQAGDEAGLLIGNRGKTLISLQTVLALIFRQKSGTWKRILVNIADWREKEQSRLEELAQHTAERVRSTGQEQYLYNLTPAQRRIVHMFLASEPDLQTESQGEGRERFLIVSPKK